MAVNFNEYIGKIRTWSWSARCQQKPWHLFDNHIIPKTKGNQFDNCFVIGGTVSCLYDNLPWRWHQWQQRCHIDELFYQCVEIRVYVTYCFDGTLSLQYTDVIMDPIASQITSLISVSSTVYSGADQKNIKAPRHWPLCGHRWIPHTKGQ